MRFLHLASRFLLLVAVVALHQRGRAFDESSAVVDDQAAAATADEQEASAERVVELAKRYRFFADAAQSHELTLHAEPLLTYSNPVRGDVYGNVFVWTDKGRPEVMAAIFDYRTEEHFDTELHVFSRGGIVGVRDDKPFWNPPEAGVEFKAVPGAASPANTSAARLRQMRELARGFTVERDHPEQGLGDMRLLVQPLYRYEIASNDVLDGGMFVFVEATDPEAILLLEASGEPAEWRFAMARVNIVEFRARYGGVEVWHVEPVSWDDVFDKQQPYAIVRESPQRGLVRTP
jgi:hypothetical protein